LQIKKKGIENKELKKKGSPDRSCNWLTQDGDPLKRKIPHLGERRRMKILTAGKKNGDAEYYRRCYVIFLLTGGMTVLKVYKLTKNARSCIYSILDRFIADGLKGLEDKRKFNGMKKTSEQFCHRVREMVKRSPDNYGWCRPTWTRELLCRTMSQRYNINVSVATMGRILSYIGAKLKRPRPVVNCPWSQQRREARVNEIQHLIDTLPKNEIVLYQDEVDIHLNPKIGQDWMLKGQQKLVITPGKNEKCYIAGALDTATGEITFVEGLSKNSLLFCNLVDQIMSRYSWASKVHLILDNYIIHKSKVTQKHLKKYEARLNLEFLPPYCPNHNRIERKWQDLHSQVTRNHKCKTLKQLMQHVRLHLNRAGHNQTMPMRLEDVATACNG
jgi:transposase